MTGSPQGTADLSQAFASTSHFSFSRRALLQRFFGGIGRQARSTKAALLHGDLTVGWNGFAWRAFPDLQAQQSFETLASDVRRVGSQADWVRADALTHRKQLLASVVGSTSRRVTAVRAWSGATPARALLGFPDDGAVCRGHVRSNYSVQGQAFGIIGL